MFKMFFFIFFISCTTPKNITQNNNSANVNNVSETVNSKSLQIPNDAGLLWSPILWYISTNEDLVTDDLNIKQVSLIIKEISTKKEKSIIFENKQQKNFTVLNKTNINDTFYSPYFINLNEGEYLLSAIKYNLNYKGSQVDKLVNILLSAEQTDQLTFTIYKNKISALPRIVVHTKLSNLNDKILDTSGIEFVDKDVISVNLILNRAFLSDTNYDKIVNASSEFPRLSVNLSNNNTQTNKALLGIMLTTSCNMNGMIRFIFKKPNDLKDYVYEYTTSQNTICKGKRTSPLKIALPLGDWILRSIHYINSNALLIFKDEPLNNPSLEIKNYLELNSFESNFFASKEPDIHRPLSISIKELSKTDKNINPLLFFGEIELLEDAMTIMWKRDYNLKTLQNAFDVQSIFNAYSYEPLTEQRSAGKIQTNLSVEYEKNAAKKLENSFSELKKKMSEHIAECILEREKTDPLFLISGHLSFSATKKTNTLNQNDIIVKSDNYSVLEIKSCLQKRLISFRFSEKINASFQAKFSFKLE